MECGGSGGCDGATAELAYEYVNSFGGLASEPDYSYISGSGQVPACAHQKDKSVIKVNGYVNVPENDHNAVLTALATEGPLVIGVDARDWSWYDEGIFSECSRDAVVNHAVVAVGYGHQKLYDG